MKEKKGLKGQDTDQEPKGIMSDSPASNLPSQTSDYHIPVLLSEVIESLNIKPHGIYVDCTFGGGGHSRAILSKLGKDGKLFVFDQDEDARQNLPDDPRIFFIPHNFRYLKRFLQLNGIKEVDGILADLGVSSYQFDEAGRGFSTRFDAALDMRMDRRQEKTAFDIVSSYSEHQLHKLFEQFGEVTNAKTLARTIAEVRKTMPLQTIEAFKNAVRSIVKGNPNKYFAQVFQALRIEVNDELGALKELLQQVPQVLRKEGRVAIITFHSLEDRLVKIFYRDGTFEKEEQHPFETVNKLKSELKPINKKPVEATEQEKRANPRSRSAKLRVAEKI
jgi:16S rRNA (cytosine1402-N4)-methyltransferase